jgi:integrase/recombinase XerD
MGEEELIASRISSLMQSTNAETSIAVSKFRRYFGSSRDRLGLEEGPRVKRFHLVAAGLSWPGLNSIVCALWWVYPWILGEKRPSSLILQ